MRRRVVGVALVGAWLVCLGWLAARELGPAPEGGTQRGTVRLAPGAAFYGVLLAGRQIGTAGITLDTMALGYRMTEVTALDLPSERGTRRDVARGEAVLSRSLGLESVQLILSEAAASSVFEAEMRQDSTLRLQLTRGRSDPDRFQLVRPQVTITIPAAIPFRLAAARALRPRGRQAVASVDLMGRTLHEERAEITADSVFMIADSATLNPANSRWEAVPGDSVRAWRVERVRTGGPPVVDWVDATGRLVRREHAFGVTLEHSPFEVNYTNYQAALRERRAEDPPLAISGLARLVDEVSLPAASAVTLEVVLSRWDGPAWPHAVEAMAGGRQRVRGDTVEIAASPKGGTDSTPPPRPRNTMVMTPADASILQAAVSDALTGLAPGGDTLGTLARWVARAVQYVDSETAPTGSPTVARSRRGGLEGKVLLFVALAEMAGYPARPVYGVEVGRGHLPAHLWAEVWRGGWEAVDPVFGRVPASTSLLRIGEGATVRPLAMVTQAGGLRVRVLR